MSDTNPADDQATGLQDGPTRDEIEMAVNEFNDAQDPVTNVSAAVHFGRWSGYVIDVWKDDQRLYVFDYLWELEEWAEKNALVPA